MPAVTRPGIYRDLTANEYFADPAPAPSISQSIAKLLIAKSPLHAWSAHPRLNPDYEQNDDKKFDLGNAAHSLMLARGKEIAIIEHDSYRTKAARAEREAAIARNVTPILGFQYAKANRLVEAAREQLTLRRLNVFDPEVGSSEAVLIWQERRIWARQMLDWLSDDRITYCDYKTTDESAAPATLGRKMWNDGWHIQAAMCERGLNAIDNNLIVRRFLFVCQETQPPYQLTVAEIDEDALKIGRQQLDYAFELFERCQQEDVWPGYKTDIVHPAIPSWAESEWLNQQIGTAAQERMVTEIV